MRMKVVFVGNIIRSLALLLFFIEFCFGGRSESHTPTVERSASKCFLANGTNYTCDKGYCCEAVCCPYYYELWWFWFIWVLAILLSFCCAYHHKRKNRQTGFRTSPLYDNHDIYSGACNYPGPPLDNKSEMMGYTKLPIYDDVIRIPPTASPPPPYSSRRQPVNTVAYVQRDENHGASLQIVECNITSSMLSLASLSHYIPDILTRANFNFGSSGCSSGGGNRRRTNNNTSSVQNNQTDSIIEDTATALPSLAALQQEVAELEAAAAIAAKKTDEADIDAVEVIEETPPSCSSRNSITASTSSSSSSSDDDVIDDVPRVIVRSITTSNSAEELDYETDSDAEDDWLIGGADRNNNIDPNNNNVVVDIEKLCAKDSADEEVAGEMLASPKNHDVSPMASIQDLIEDPQAY